MRIIDHYMWAVIEGVLPTMRDEGDGGGHPARVLAERAASIAEACAERVCEVHGHEYYDGRCDRCSRVQIGPATEPPPSSKEEPEQYEPDSEDGSESPRARVGA